jgi:pilus assembly protein Flp/PilA
MQASDCLNSKRADDQAPIYIFTVAHGSCSADGRKPEDSMKYLAKKMQHFLTSEDGPTAVEYAVMLALIIIVCLAAISAIGTKASATFTTVGNSIAS